MKLVIVNELNLTATELLTTKLGLEDYLPKLSPWAFGKVEVSTANFIGDASKAVEFDGFDMKVYITNRKGKSGIAGFHDIENGKPVAYVKPGTFYSRFGYYHAGITVKGKVIFPETMKMGMFGVLVHEVAEMLGNPLRNTFSVPDSQGRCWYREITDHVHGNDFMKVINGVKCIFPDTALPNFYVVGAITNLSVKGNLTKSFTLTPKGYGSYKGADGKLAILRPLL